MERAKALAIEVRDAWVEADGRYHAARRLRRGCNWVGWSCRHPPVFDPPPCSSFPVRSNASTASRKRSLGALHYSHASSHNPILVQNFFEELRQVAPQP